MPGNKCACPSQATDSHFKADSHGHAIGCA